MKTTKSRPISVFSLSLRSNKFLMLFLVLLVLPGITGFDSVKKELPEPLFNPGVVFEIETKDHEQSPPRTQEMEVSIEGRNLTMSISPREGQSGKGKMIFKGDRGKNGEVVLVDDDRKSYMVLDDAFVSTMGSKLSEAEKMMQEAYKNLTKEQIAMIEKAQKQGGKGLPGMPGMKSKGPKAELKKTSDRATKEGYPCVKYDVYEGDLKIREIWTTDWNNIDGGGEARDAFLGMNNFFEGLMDKMGDLTGDMNPYDGMNFENGFPVGIMNFGDDGGLEDESWLKRTRRQRIDPDAFEPPSGYKRRSMF